MKNNFNNVELKAKASKIKLIAFDVDGVMTTGDLIFGEDGKEYKTFNVKDGLGIVKLRDSGVIPAIITARDNATVKVRAKTLGIEELHEGQKNKSEALDKILSKYNLKEEQIAYMGDDLPDMCVMTRVGLSSCPQDAVDEVKEIVDFVSTKKGGKGAVREICDFIRKVQGN